MSPLLEEILAEIFISKFMFKWPYLSQYLTDSSSYIISLYTINFKLRLINFFETPGSSFEWGHEAVACFFPISCDAVHLEQEHKWPLEPGWLIIKIIKLCDGEG